MTRLESQPGESAEHGGDRREPDVAVSSGGRQPESLDVIDREPVRPDHVTDHPEHVGKRQREEARIAPQFEATAFFPGRNFLPRPNAAPHKDPDRYPEEAQRRGDKERAAPAGEGGNDQRRNHAGNGNAHLRERRARGQILWLEIDAVEFASRGSSGGFADAEQNPAEEQFGKGPADAADSRTE